VSATFQFSAIYGGQSLIDCPLRRQELVPKASERLSKGEVMSDLEVQPAVESAPEAVGLSQWQRVTNTFSAPSKTFEDIKSGNKSWWLPFIVMLLIGYVFTAAVTQKVGWTQGAGAVG